jgi:hypothetical protein
MFGNPGRTSGVYHPIMPTAPRSMTALRSTCPGLPVASTIFPLTSLFRYDASSMPVTTSMSSASTCADELCLMSVNGSSWNEHNLSRRGEVIHSSARFARHPIGVLYV